MMKEEEIQATLVNRLRSAEQLELGFRFWSTQNGVHLTSWSQRNKFKSQGGRTGIPDLFITRRIGRRFYAWELKAKKGKLGPNQPEWLEYFGSLGWETAVTYGWDEAERQAEQWQFPGF